ncbi:MAG TPA: phosphoserine phosphatase SerB, partial [Alphaproteobacteria bacterium]|nr:phosphoserine phosphatase SerB [Alphaproteobacteria bacterium]
MQILLTLICDPARPVIDAGLLDAVRDKLEDLGGIAGTPDWLAPGIACDLACAGVSPAEAAPAIRTVIGNAPVDLVIHEEREE